MTDNKKRRVVVTGLGPVSPIATGKKDYWQALHEGRNGIHSITSFDVPVRSEMKRSVRNIAGTIKMLISPFLILFLFFSCSDS